MAKRISMNVSVTAAQEKRIRARVRRGQYLSASEVFRAALAALDEREAIQREWRRMIQQGLNDAKRGRVVDGEAYFDELTRRDERAHRRKAG
jgi:putative addiction module CopG family antidote